jgi:hypothetical protein
MLQRSVFELQSPSALVDPRQASNGVERVPCRMEFGGL